MDGKIELDITLVEDSNGGGYTGWFTDFPAVINQGDTVDELKASLLVTLKMYVKILSE